MCSRTFINRMSKELGDLELDPPPHIICYPSEDSMAQLDVHFQGPPGTPYESGLFRLDVTVPETYPFDPPMIKFLTPVYHPNIDDSGRICANVLKKGKDDQWKPSMNLRTTLLSLHALMGAPNPNDPLDVDIAREYQQDYDLFVKKAREHTMKFAVDRPEKVPRVAIRSLDKDSPSSTTEDRHNISSSTALDGNIVGGVGDPGTVLSQESPLSNTVIDPKPKRKSKISLSRKKVSVVLSQHSIDLSQQPAATTDENDPIVKSRIEAASFNGDMENGSNDKCHCPEQSSSPSPTTIPETTQTKESADPVDPTSSVNSVIAVPSSLSIEERPSPPLQAPVCDVDASTETPTITHDYSPSDDGIFTDLSSSFNSDPLLQPKRKRNKISLSCKKKFKAA